MLNNGFNLNDSFENYNTDTLMEQATKKVYTPGYYFGLNITL